MERLSMVRVPAPPPAEDSGSSVPRPFWFWTGLLLIAGGLALHIPMFFAMDVTDGGTDGAMDDGMAGGMSGGVSSGANLAMTVGMVLLAAGLAAAVAGVVQRRPPEAANRTRYRVEELDEVRMGGAHYKLTAVLSLALVIDIMKPATLAFILPGMRREYGLTEGQVSVLPVVALTGTVAGSLLWGYLGDRVGRRVTILLSCMVFVATTVCAVMPTFFWNLVMCFLMGAAAGGLLPVAYAMTAETVPRRRRGMLMVLQAGLATVLAYLATSGLAALLIPRYGWRVMWFTHLPFAVLLLVLQRWIPESPRYLAATGRTAAAREVSERFGMTLVPDPVPAAAARPPAAGRERRPTRSAMTELFGRRGLRRTAVVGLYALSWGGINWGFMTFLPTLLKDAHDGSGGLLVWSSLLAVPGTVLVAFCYARWSSRKTMVLYGLLTVAALALLAVTDLHGGTLLTVTSLMMLITGTSGIVAMLAPYTAEIYPTGVRALGSGFASACSKAGGMFGPPLLAALLAQHGGVRTIAVVVAVPMAVAVVAVALYGTETRGRSLAETAVAYGGTDPVRTLETEATS
jgi:putative MFS transporter